MKFEIELPTKFETPLKETLGALQLLNHNEGLTNEDILAKACKLFIIQEYAKYLDSDDDTDKPTPEAPE